jgi:hypothetical protein
MKGCKMKLIKIIDKILEAWTRWTLAGIWIYLCVEFFLKLAGK